MQARLAGSSALLIRGKLMHSLRSNRFGANSTWYSRFPIVIVIPSWVVEMRPAVLRVSGAEIVSTRIVANAYRILSVPLIELINPPGLRIPSLVPIGSYTTGLLAHGYSALALALSKMPRRG
jgi:hypothetical protein